ncbi:MAG: TSUP family transporter, partial [Acidimicrobiia bacterium]
MDWGLALGGLGVGLVVGLTGMGGGALMTPILVIGFGIAPLAAVSSDLVAAVVMKPIGGTIHFRRGTVHAGLVRCLALGSVPGALVGSYVISHLGD